MWTNPLDKLPQVPQDWANHIIYGSSAVVLMLLGVSPLWATLALIGANGAKKIVDYFKESEPLWMCIGKTLVGGLWGFTVLLVLHFKG